MDEIRTKLANKLLAKFHGGESSLDDAEFGLDRASLYSATESELLELGPQYGDDAFDELSSMHPSWPEERRILISEGRVNPNPVEIAQHAEIVLENDDSLQFTIMVGKFPLRQRNRVVGWVLIREAGIALDREYKIAGVFDAEAEADLFFRENFALGPRLP